MTPIQFITRKVGITKKVRAAIANDGSHQHCVTFHKNRSRRLLIKIDGQLVWEEQPRSL